MIGKENSVQESKFSRQFLLFTLHFKDSKGISSIFDKTPRQHEDNQLHPRVCGTTSNDSWRTSRQGRSKLKHWSCAFGCFFSATSCVSIPSPVYLRAYSNWNSVYHPYKRTAYWMELCRGFVFLALKRRCNPCTIITYISLIHNLKFPFEICVFSWKTTVLARSDNWFEKGCSGNKEWAVLRRPT